ncbi:hypothetical protein EXIGLDRAFT_719149 [Exidia glandulosa HHB12029]|uniref:ATPase AAA-type core domain-containing protein n=1 Tax=Exidia glandulosa HHB12029 TaxID=1314781 RepID=A0A165H9P3_EXIGL|nr:hypothetical protein EXIGLDRAFT_719149 [Exidia glandulosa HHB12029]
MSRSARRAPETRLPLHGDGKGNYRVLLVGNAGTGKSTVAKQLSQLLGIRLLHLDSIFWQANWVRTPFEDVRKQIKRVVYHDNWVIDGNAAVKGLIPSRATDIIWLDPPLVLYFPRLFWRTILRLFDIGPPPAPGCNESVRRMFFSTDSVLWYALKNHTVIRARYTPCCETEKHKWRRIGGWGSALRTWLGDVEDTLEVMRAQE